MLATNIRVSEKSRAFPFSLNPGLAHLLLLHRLQHGVLGKFTQARSSTVVGSIWVQRQHFSFSQKALFPVAPEIGFVVPLLTL